MSNNNLSYKSASVQFKVNNDEGVYRGFFSVFGNVDEGNDVIHQGAFTKSIKERGNRIKVFFAHDFDKLIGPPPDVLREDENGLFAEGRLAITRNGEPGSFWANEAWALMKAGALTEGSIGFNIVPGKFDFSGEGVRNLREVKLIEISPVPLGMNPLTSVMAVKSRPSHENLQLLMHALDAINDERLLITAKKSQLAEVKANLDALAGTMAEVLAAADKPSTTKANAHLSLLQLRRRAAQLALSNL